ncbi:hypothetical protein ACEPAI_7456 [Sanghuangporus weigelae]
MSSDGAQPDLDSTYGCLFLTGMYVPFIGRGSDLVLTASSSSFSTALWAISCLQLWFYIEKYFQSDKPWLKICTILLWILETVYLVLVLKFLYIYFVKQFGNVDFLNNLDSDIYNSAPFSPVIVALIHGFYVMRAFNLSNQNYLLAGALALLSVVQLVYASVYMHLVHVRPLSTTIKFERAMNVLVFITDISIALAIVILLWRRRSGFKRTEGLIKRLVALTIGTSLITGVMAILALVVAEVLPNTFIYLIIDFCISKLYYNCMLASLNARSVFRRQMDGTIEMQSFDLEHVGQTGSDTRDTSVTVMVDSNPAKAFNPNLTECKADIDIKSDSGATRYHGEDSSSDFQDSGNLGDSEIV